MSIDLLSMLLGIFLRQRRATNRLGQRLVRMFAAILIDETVLVALWNLPARINMSNVC